MAAGAGFSFFSVDEEVHLKISSLTRGVDKVADSGATAVDGLPQGLTENTQQAFPISCGERCCCLLGMDVRSVEGLVGVDVADAGHHMAVHKEGFDWLPALPCSLPEVGDGAGTGKGFGAGCGKELLFFSAAVFEREELDGAKSSGIIVSEFCVVIQEPTDMVMDLLRRSCRKDTQIAGHSQVNDESGTLVNFQNQVLGPPGETHDLGAAEFILHLLAGNWSAQLLAGTVYAEDGPRENMRQ